ncbi:succinate dehydrogenase, hydrophobic membrane anchor protein [Thalassovita mediterranea]|jgi:succinate dehydrogenase / fumarate reductase membrane anchor subunit|uniref:Succinate dehydrogenase hydrophobic membrane anchor subunit n=1 Tax=Thalassovita mediterranea TaxID=340021 RepID=A0A0P1GLB4_9RHOB|nr:succinate dehydrogenase, hydrophobic membrane anchor protein [Thalassovita mediterranea]MCG7573399.1 succinate dehydrogenase, hydrophobic membrane anchor protein [Phaeobacter sp. CNT1-3]CUH83060.1 succinate dehydrogenase, hydrophobic membrane anchor protein [Thalassovita mediterranea]SIS31169.1 succinate dehydrogenase subunit D [Thalassovita mediterranea]
MRYLTARKRAEGKGASHTGTEHHWYMTVSAVGLAVMMPIFMLIFGSALGSTHEEVIATFSRPVPAVLTALVLLVGLRHFAKGAQMMIEDYLQGTARKVAIMFAIGLSYALTAFGLFALAKIAL